MKELVNKTQITDVMNFLLVVMVIFIGAKFGQYLFFDWKTSPAIIWPPTGIAVAVIWMSGYRYLVPVFIGLLLASLSGPYGNVYPAAITTPMAQVAGHALGVFLLRRYNFDETFSTVKSVLTFLIIISVLCLVAPTVTTIISAITGNLTTSALISFTRAWGGYVFSCLILTPFILLWNKKEQPVRVVNPVEIISILLLLITSVYLLFFDDVLPQYSFIYFTLFFIAHFWICLRFSTRMVALSVMLTSIVGSLGVFISPDPERMLNDQLFEVELFLFLIVPIFYIFSALVKERSGSIESLKVMMDKTERENIIKNEFIAVLAHELRNPLAPIKTTFEILELKDLDRDTKNLIKDANQQVYSMKRLLDDLLDITRVTQGKFQLRFELINICTVINQCINSTQEIFKERNHTLVLDQVCDDSLWINVDPVRFEQVIVNVLNNAAKYTPPGGRIEIFQSVVDNHLVFKVRDNGIGIKKNHLEDIFQSFWQMSTAHTHGSGGIGVGLALTRQIINLHGGTIHAESEGENMGTTFVITLPGVATSNGAAPFTVPVTPSVATRSLHILIVDDNAVAADSMAQLLTIKNHQVTTLYTGQAALAEVSTLQPDLILLDIGLTDMSGYEVAAQLRSKGYRNQLIALTGYGQKQDKEKALESGFDFHFTKPMSLKNLEEYLAQHIEA